MRLLRSCFLSIHNHNKDAVHVGDGVGTSLTTVVVGGVGVVIGKLMQFLIVVHV